MLPRLNFIDRVDGRPHILSSDFIFGTLLLNKSPVLESFHLERDCECSASQIELWVRFAVDRFVRDLSIAFNLDRCVVRFPSRLFRCETLETLHLQNVILLKVPSWVSFQSLKTLRLVAVKYADEEVFLRLISSSLVLKNLVVGSCEDENVKTFTINVPSLQSLTIWTNEEYYRLFVIHSHSLKELDIENEYGEVKFIGDMPELVKASVKTYESKGNVLKCLTFVKRLSLTHFGSKVQYHIGTIFSQLVCLDFRGFCNNWWDLLVNLLQHSPRLEILKFEDDGEDELEDDKGCWIQPSCAPECLYHLKTFEWRDYEGKPIQKQVAVYILKNASRLVTATLRFDPYMVSKKAFKELEYATRGSRACELTMMC
ncbi:PREDICTED: F-box/FBD/LRR-repeat protein At5g56420-like [Camelina sativa]|uniref:F-box/FBD/LRR-repeat protein At5g56420-like n=1 Tax=Camelina sativa TaxID=90675 RepID=A0ABM0ZAN5_CAMSA|nr:PREDICTED: F-box/FBD/LRR-repeat protein At5g56420-like [Camelina sativa]